MYSSLEASQATKLMDTDYILDYMYIANSCIVAKYLSMYEESNSAALSGNAYIL